MSVRPELDEQLIAEACRRFGVRRLSLFGSAGTDAFDPERSDVDFFVEFEDAIESHFDAYFGLKSVSLYP